MHLHKNSFKQAKLEHFSHSETIGLYSQHCWNKHLDPRWSCFCLGCHASKLKVKVTFRSLNMLYLIRDTVRPISQSPQAIPTLGSTLISLFLLTPNKVDCVAPASQIFSLFLYLVLYSSAFNSFLSSTLFAFLQMETASWSVKVNLYHPNCLL